ncbi:hypothetical protein OPQ81_005210 [Rhizoctonia solani]|nr:hypothetical protein OPQ81_005210 [Rhizoctonia solani]
MPLWRLLYPPYGIIIKQNLSRKLVHPPSPKSLPFIGNLISLPAGPEHIIYTELGKQLNSDIIYLDLLGNDIVVLNSIEAASDLLDKRSSLYSDRFCPLMFEDKSLLDWSTSPPFLRYNDVWRHQRRMMNKWLNVREVSQFYKMLEDRTRFLLQHLLAISTETHPFDGVKDGFFFAMGSSIFQMAYGYTLQGKSDPFFKAAHDVDDDALKALMVTNYYVNVFPILKHVPEWVPGAGWKRSVRELREHKEYALDAPFRWTQNQVGVGTNEHSIIGELLQDHHLMSGLNHEERDNRLKELGHALYSGGADTTASLILSFVAAMVLNSDVQSQAQKEIDLVLGPGVLPTIADRGQLPYINRLILELLRWRPALAIGVPHRCLEDDVYRGYNITKGTIVIGNLWAMSRDENIYKEPERFNPDRFLDPGVPPIPAFGWGRRICPGMHFGEASLFITIASLLATFTFSKKRDSNGNYIEPIIEDAPNSIVLGLKPFEFELAPRSEMYRRAINEALQTRALKNTNSSEFGPSYLLDGIVEMGLPANTYGGSRTHGLAGGWRWHTCKFSQFY